MTTTDVFSMTTDDMNDARYALVSFWYGDSNDRLREYDALVSLAGDYDDMLDRLTERARLSLWHRYDIPSDATVDESDTTDVIVSGYMATDATTILDREYASFRDGTMTLNDLLSLESCGLLHVSRHTRIASLSDAIERALDDASSDSMIYVYCQITIETVYDDLYDAIRDNLKLGSGIGHIVC